MTNRRRMINLLRAETQRFASRRMVWIGFALAVVALAGLIVLMAFETREPSPAEIAQGQQFYQQQHQDWEQNHTTYEKQCKESNPEGTDCTMPEPTPEDFARKATSFDGAASLLGMVGTVFLGFASMVVAASLVGADFTSGAMANWLSFVPVRWRVYLSRLIVAVVGTTAISAVLLTVTFAVMAMIVSIQQPGPITGWGTVAGLGGRGLALVAMASVFGFTVSFLTRRTIATVGIVLGYLVARLVLLAFSTMSWYGKLVPALPENNAIALLQKDYHYQVAHRVVSAQGVGLDFTEKILPWEQGLIYLLVAVVVLIGASLFSFIRRDVT